MNSNKRWELRIDECVYKKLDKLPIKDSLKIIEVIEFLPFDLYEGDIQKIKGEKDVWRRRIGSYRIFYTIYKKENIVNVFWVERRGSKTYSR